MGGEVDCRAAYQEQLKQWVAREPERAAEFTEGLKILQDWPIEYLATGHGPILHGEIKEFLQELIAIARP